MYIGSDHHKRNLDRARAAQKRDKPCLHCGAMYFQSGIIKHERSCRSNPENQRVCEVCGKSFTGKGVTCSHGCANTKFRTGPDHGNWKDDSYRSTCFHYHEKKCVVCPETVIVEVHHLDEDNTNNSPENLIPLCPTHHQYWHSRHRHLIEDQVISYLNLWKELVSVRGLEPPACSSRNYRSTA